MNHGSHENGRHVEDHENAEHRDPISSLDGRGRPDIGHVRADRDTEANADRNIVNQTHDAEASMDEALHRMRHPEDDDPNAEEARDFNPNNSRLLVDREEANEARQRRTRADEILNQFGVTEAATPMQVLPQDLAKDVKIITPAQLHLMIERDVAGSHESEVAVLDLRSPDIDGDKYHVKIKGAFELPMIDEAGGNQIKLSAKKNNKDFLYWKRLLELPNSPLIDISTKPVVVIHCWQSQSRTPSVASGYVKWLSRRKGTQVLILKDGMRGYTDAYGLVEKTKPRTAPKDKTMEIRGELEESVQAKNALTLSKAMADVDKVVIPPKNSKDNDVSPDDRPII